MTLALSSRQLLCKVVLKNGRFLELCGSTFKSGPLCRASIKTYKHWDTRDGHLGGVVELFCF